MIHSYNSFSNFRLIVTMLLLVFFFTSCFKSDNIKTVSIETEYLPNFKGANHQQLISIEDTLMVAFIDKKGVNFYNTYSHHTDSIQIDNMPSNIRRIDVVNFNSFAFSTKDSIFIYNNGYLQRIHPQLPDNVILTCHDLFAFFPKQQKYIIEVVDYNNPENYNYLYECDYLGNTKPIQLQYS